MEKYLKMLKFAKKVALFAHVSPDPDTIGSVVALAEILKKMGKTVDMFSPDFLPENYYFLEEVKNFKDEPEEYDLLVAVDVSSYNRLGRFEEFFKSHPNTLRIDHHVVAEGIDSVNKVFPYSACAVAIYEIAKKLRVKVTPTIATALYFGICGDTGIFKNNNTDSKTFETCAELVSAGAEIRRVYTEFFEKKTVPYIHLSSNILLNAKLNRKLGYAIMTVSVADYEKFGASLDENVSGIPHSYLNAGFKVAVILKEKEDGIHCSFRSKFEYDVAMIAEQFGGGGHKNASGARVEGTLNSVSTKVEKAIKEYLKNL